MRRLTARQYAESLALVPTKSRPLAARNLLTLLRRLRAMRLVPRIQLHLQRLEDIASKTTRVHIEAATEGDARTALRLLKKHVQKTVSDVTVDQRHQAGFAVRLGDDQIDATLRTQLQRLRTTLLR